jgi:serine/threonine protein kinase
MALLADVAAGLAALHARAIVHRDLKPHNVLITDSCRAKLSDMGLSKQLVPEQSSFESHGAGGFGLGRVEGGAESCIDQLDSDCEFQGNAWQPSIKPSGAHSLPPPPKQT